MALARTPLCANIDRLYSLENSFRQDLDSFVVRFRDLWEEAGAEAPVLRTRYDSRQQRQNGRRLDLLINLVEAQLHHFPNSLAERDSWRRDVLSKVRQACVGSLGLPVSYVDLLLSPEYVEVTKGFIRRAKDFDPEMSFGDLGQAMRNVWVANYLQLLLGRKPSLNSSIFAYSMLYPCTDNYLDRPDLDRQAKAAFNRRFGLRLGGSGLLPLEPHERQVFNLVRMIEGEYPRCDFPEVYQSLLAIHRAQVQSLAQQGPESPLDAEQILRISIEKGGASVLADGYLIDGALSREEAEFAFGFGVVLQLQDDLQDLQSDRQSQRWTTFSRPPADATLDATTSRLCRFLTAVMEMAGRFPACRCMTLQGLIRDNCLSLMLQSIAINSDRYSRAYLQHMESFSPLSFSYLRKLIPRLEKKQAGIMESFRRRANALSIIDLLG